MSLYDMLASALLSTCSGIPGHAVAVGHRDAAARLAKVAVDEWLSSPDLLQGLAEALQRSEREWRATPAIGPNRLAWQAQAVIDYLTQAVKGDA